MQKLIFTISIIALLSLPILVNGQTSFGIRGGYSVSSMSYRYSAGRPAVRTGGISAPTFAFVMEHFAGKNAGIQIEIQYLTLGYIQTDTLLVGTNQTELNYLKMPVLSNFYAGKGGRFHIKIGPHFGYLLNATDVQRDFEGPLFLPTYGTPEDNPRKFMYGLTAGAGLSKLFGKSTLEADLRFSYEFGRPETLDRIFDMNSTNIELTLTYLFRVAKLKTQK
ncbi:porin family protein [Aquiflexum gelatinilyticum]|uniref:PorT family protein n=1 Tax=Aquiflexum gelatinilyticum TaxID=2961943 RepID=A0A9X2P6H6_9BACT|nr:porin family protein [Aquiflexum gelatinilyticum]MCR9015208.1 PorT family protein [Aquiflexum gelatinilyticum]